MQVQESVNASNFLLVGTQAASGKSTAKQDKNAEALDFASFLSESKENPVENISRNTGKKETEASIVNTQDRVSQKKEDVKTEETGSRVTNSSGDETSESVTDETKVMDESVSADTVPDGEISEVEETEVLELVSSIFQMVMESFQLSGEELAGKLEEFGMEVEDLLNADGLKEFFLNMKSADVSDLIVDENLNQELQTFMEDFDQLLKESGVTQTDLTGLAEKEELVEVVTDFSNLQDVTAKDSQKPSLHSQEEGMEPAIEQPEVIVTEQREEKQADVYHSQKEADTGSSKEMPEKNTETLKETVLNKQEGVENPILQAIQDAVNQVEEIATSNQPITGRDIVNQIVEQVRINMSQNTTSLEMQLYPEHLGKIQIHVVSKDGMMTARIVAETEAAKQAIEGGLTNLKEAMQQQELKVDAIEVMVSTTGFERGNEEQKSFNQENASRGRRKIDLSELDEDIVKTEEAEIEKMRQMGSSVSYTA